MPIKINVGELFRSEPGTQKEYEIDIPVFEDEEFHVFPEQKMRLIGYKIDKGIAISTDDMTVKGTANCVKTLKDFNLETELYPTEKQFYLTKPDDLDDDEEFEKIDHKTFDVDVEEIVREAVFLGLPTILVSPEGEKMQVEVKQTEDIRTTKPFADLKNLINE
jgi:uncharacterized metal-binding protein YceD (DUF177 family)